MFARRKVILMRFPLSMGDIPAEIAHILCLRGRVVDLHLLRR